MFQTMYIAAPAVTWWNAATESKNDANKQLALFMALFKLKFPWKDSSDFHEHFKK